MRIDDNTDISNTKPLGNRVSVIGLGSQFDSNSPFDSDYLIYPRYKKDLSFTTSTDYQKINYDIRLTPQPSNNFVRLEGKTEDLQVIEIYSLTGKLISIQAFKPEIETILDSGVYLLKVKGQNISYSLKLLIQK